MINPITLLNANIKTPNIFNKHKNEEKENQDDGAEVVMKNTPNDSTENKTDLDGPQFIDELANVPVMNMDDFISKYVDDDDVIESDNDSVDSVDALDFEENNTGRKDRLNLLQRRWRVVIWDLEIENLVDGEASVFVEIDFGTSREEFRVQLESKEYILSNGDLKHRLRTPIVHNLLKEKPQKIKFHPSFEYRGSYHDIEKEKLKLSAWKYHNFRLNTLDAMFEVKLITCANSDIRHNCYLMRLGENQKLERVYKVQFNLYFQEIYDFQLSLDRFEIKGLMTYDDIVNKLSSLKRKMVEKTPLNKTSLIEFNVDRDLNRNNSLVNYIPKITDLDGIGSKRGYRSLLENITGTIDKPTEKRFDSISFNYSENKAENISDQSKINQSEILNVCSSVDRRSSPEIEAEHIEKKGVWDTFLRFLGILKDDQKEEVQKLDSLLLEAELDQAKLHPAGCNPRLKVDIVWPTTLKNYTIYSSVQKGTNWPIWEDLGSIYLRGTIADLENCFIDVEVLDYCKDREISSQARTHIPLKGLVESNTVIESNLYEPLWLLRKVNKTEERRLLATWEFGTITGNISFKNYPLQRQKGNFIHFVKDRLYLMIKIIRIDNIITFENLENPQVNISVTHQGLTAKSNSILSNGQKEKPTDDYIIFPLQLPPISELYFFHLESLGEIYIDLWVSSNNQNNSKMQHAGFTSFTIWDTIYSIKGTKRPISERYTSCYTSGSNEKLKVRVYEQETPLKFLFPTDRVANITFEAFIMPDLLSVKPKDSLPVCSKDTGIAEKIDMFLRTRMELSPSQAPKLYQNEKISIETTLISKLGTGTIGRFFIFSSYNHRGNELMLSQFVSSIPAPNGVSTPRAIFHFIRCIPFINTSFREPPKRTRDKFNSEPSKNESLKRGSQESKNTYTLGKSYYWFTPDFTLLNNGGGIIDHCLLHVSLLLKQKIQAFVCIGTITGGSFHSWVMSWHFSDVDNSTYIKFWEVTTGQIYVLKNRFISQQRAREVTLRFRKRERLLSSGVEPQTNNSHLKTVKLPYRSIDTIFNEVNIWYNIQDNTNPGSIFFDLWNTSMFVSCTNTPLVHQPGFRSQPYSSVPGKSDMTNMKSQLKSVLHYEIQSRRNAQNLGTRWNMDPTLNLFLEKGLEIIERSEISSEDEYPDIIANFSDWKHAIESKVPAMHRLLGFPLSFNHADPKVITEAMFGKLEILFTRDKSATLSISVTINGYPNHVLCCRIFILVIQKISERERKKIMEKREKNRLREEKVQGIDKSSTLKLGSINLKQDESISEAHNGDNNDETDKGMNDTIDKENILKADVDVSIPLVTADFIGILDKENKMVRKRRVVLPDGSVFGNLWISKKIRDDGNFRYYIEGIERSVSEGLNIPKNRVCATELNYQGQRVGFAILPGLCEDDISPMDLMYEMALKVDELLKSDKNFIEFTGGDAVLEWDYDQTEDDEEQCEVVEYLDDEDNEVHSESELSEVEEEYSQIEQEEGSDESGPEEATGNTDLECEEDIEYLSSNASLISNIVVDSNEEDELHPTFSHPLKRESTDDDISDVSNITYNKSIDNEVKAVMFGGEENSEINILKKDSIPPKKVSFTGGKDLKRFTKTGKYIIYRRPEYEQSRLNKKKELSSSNMSRDDLSVYPAAALAISLARGHSDIKECGLLNANKSIYFNNKEDNKNTKIIDRLRSKTNSSSSDLLSTMFYRGDLNAFPTQIVSKKSSVGDINFPKKTIGHSISRGSSIAIRRN
ncbi:membrane protein [Cryptosporidium canis]|uniref:Membrane protein n=1 Tax=Cryptosporidium canis TaxID=195482 RepID=A0A9D5HX28_9CRYT|nr:membrane protein [Cryptosporidium canis]